MVDSVTTTNSSTLLKYLERVAHNKNVEDDTAKASTDKCGGDDDGPSCSGNTNYTSGALNINADILALLFQNQQNNQPPGQSFGQPANQPGSRLDAAFKAVDTNGDGSVTLAEFEAGAPDGMDKTTADALFAKIDTGNTGSITEDQLKDSIKQAQGRHHHHHHHGGGDVAATPSADDVSKIFSSVDTNGDGNISLTELETALGVKTDSASSAGASTTVTADANATATSTVDLSTASAFLKAIKSYLSAQNVQTDLTSQLGAVVTG